jgi:hypothetical protein
MTRSSRATPSQHLADDGWHRFWFSQEPMFVLGLVRIAFGALIIVWSLRLLPDLYNLFGEHGAVPRHPAMDYRWGIFQAFTGDQAILIGWGVLLLAAIAMTVGWHSRLAAILVFVLVLSFVRRDPWVFNGGDGVLIVTALYLALSSCGAALSIDQYRRTGSFWSAQCLAVWPIRLMQVQVSLIYLVSVQAKLVGTTWVDGSAVSYAWRAYVDFALLPVPEWLSNNPYLVNVATWGTILLELAIAILVWNRRWRFRVLAAGVVLHLAIFFTLSVGFFTAAMFVLYLAFVPYQTVARLPEMARNGFTRLRRRRTESPQQRDDAPVGDSTAPSEPVPGRDS